ncbi:type II toxin-antitoxin system PemK/MazF family toxin [Bacillus tropicus]|uniref:type II toxin-antitoxin system PemK/MazF family toxin n=1 Tax=Bacillus tropicus TaxID=2026188 RepID=UPI0011A24BDF|nr:type II toxin-antitoxin system PemK/MazF family toxin [Bacillus tropicus]
MSNRPTILRGDIFIANLDPSLGAEQGKQRRVLIISNDVGNANTNCPVVIAVPITGSVTPKKMKMPMYVPISPTKQNGQTKMGLIDCFQIRVLDINQRLGKKVGTAELEVMEKVDKSLEMCLQLKTCDKCHKVLLPNRNHCVNCKHVLVKVCKKCTSVINSTYNFCPHCGVKGE